MANFPLKEAGFISSQNLTKYGIVMRDILLFSLGFDCLPIYDNESYSHRSDRNQKEK